MKRLMKILVSLLIVVIALPSLALTWVFTAMERGNTLRRLDKNLSEHVPNSDDRYSGYRSHLVPLGDHGYFEYVFGRVVRVKWNSPVRRCVFEGKIKWECLELEESEDADRLKAWAKSFHWEVGPR